MSRSHAASKACRTTFSTRYHAAVYVSLQRRLSRFPDHGRELTARRHEVVLVMPLVLPRTLCLLRLEPKTLHDRAYDHPYFLHLQTSSGGGPHERDVVVNELEVHRASVRRRGA